MDKVVVRLVDHVMEGEANGKANNCLIKEGCVEMPQLLLLLFTS
jgi:hypothetical protein